MRRALLLAAVCCSAASAGKPRRFEGLKLGEKSTGPGQVTYVSQESAFIDRGSLDGVKVGEKLSVTRRGRVVGTCDVVKVNEHSAACSGTGFNAGDKLSVERKPEAPPALIAAPPSPQEVAARLKKVEAAELELVGFEGAPVGSGQAAWLEVVLTHLSASDFASANGPYHLERLDAAVREVYLWRGLNVSADVTALYWTRRQPAFRSPLTGNANLLVRRLEVAWDEPGTRYRAALGRIYLRHTPGLPVVDGAQAGVRSLSGELEGGAFGGLLPEPLRLGFSTTAWTAGAYGFARFYRGTGADAMWLQPELRAGWAVRDRVGGRFEVAASLHSWVGRAFDAHALAQVSVGSSPALDLLRVDVGLRPGTAVRFIASARYRGNPLGEVAELGATTFGTRALHADLLAAADLSRSFTLALMGGVAGDFTSTLWSGRAGAEVQLPLLSGRAGFALGYAEELGWIRGRNAWLQGSLTPHWRFKLSARASWALQDGAGLQGQELGAYAATDVRPFSFLWLRVSGLLRARPDGAGAAATLSAQLGAEL